MLILVVGVVGGVGTTTLAYELLKAGGPAVPLDLADGTLIGRLDRSCLALEMLALRRGSRLALIDAIVNDRSPLLWTPVCAAETVATPVWELVRAIAQRLPLVADGGLEPPAAIWPLADLALAVTRPERNPVSDWHESRLKQAHPGVQCVAGDLKAAATALAAELLPRPAPRFKLGPLAVSSCWRH